MTPLADTLAPMRRNMRAFYRMIGRDAPGGSVFERDGVLAAITPSCPDRSVVNAVVYEDATALTDALDALADAYDRAGVNAWTVWVPDDDAAAAAALGDAGHVLDGRPRAMTLSLPAPTASAPPSRVDWACRRDPAALAELAEINEQAYGAPAGIFAAAMTAFANPDANVYFARVDGVAAACLVTVEEAGDCGVYLVATRPVYRRQGLAGALLAQSLRDARDHGCATSSLQATRAGYPVYRRLGYADIGEISMWERRRGRPR
jgi:GNAT superfamily N-acetyltransferase